ncbi:m106 protein [Murid betaherpesvirus 1]|nr:m106 protein [Murid betaherpesvirus 1]
MATARQQQPQQHPPPPPPGAIVPCGHTIPMLRGGGHIELCAIQGHGCLHPPLPLDDNVAATNTTETTAVTTATTQTSRKLRGNARIRLNPRPIPRPPAGPHEHHHRRRRDQRRMTQQINFMPLQSDDQPPPTTIPEIPRIVVEVVD